MTGPRERTSAALDRRLLARAAHPIALGLSGGGDSLALLLLAKAWADGHGRRLLALTVDHRLHPDSARWTAFAGEAAARAGADWRPLAWEGDKPATGLPAAARAARHRLLAGAAREAGASVILLGHTLDDRREAALMRARDAPGLGELREWAPSPAWPEGRGVFLLRPLLDISRAELRDHLRAAGWAWLDDPANEDPRFARARARRALASAAPSAADLPAAAPPAPVPWRATPDGRILVSRAVLRQAEAASLKRFVSAAVLCAGGGEVPPRGERLERLVERLLGPGRATASLAGARVATDGDEVQFGREAGERARGGLAPLQLEPGRPAVWDGRFEAVAEAPGLTLAALGGHIGALSRAERAWLRGLPASARSALPVVLPPDGPPVLPRPFGPGPASAASLVEARLRAATGGVDREVQPS